MKNANINVRIDYSLYHQLKELGIDISETVRIALVNEVEKKRIHTIIEESDLASNAVKKMGMKSIINEIRQTRERR